jgi:hypothetical protein
MPLSDASVKQILEETQQYYDAYGFRPPRTTALGAKVRNLLRMKTQAQTLGHFRSVVQGMPLGKKKTWGRSATSKTRF